MQSKMKHKKQTFLWFKKKAKLDPFKTVMNMILRLYNV